MKNIATINIKNNEDALKYSYAFMQTETLNMKECSFVNPKPTQFSKEYLVPRDAYSATYNEDIPSWELFKTNPAHLSSPGFVCVACLDKKDQKRVILSSINGDISFNCYGNYENESKKPLKILLHLI